MFWWLIRKILFSLDPEIAHALGGIFLQIRGFFLVGRTKRIVPSGARLWEFAGCKMDSPLGVAAGFDKNASLIFGLRSLGFGYVEIGSVTPRPQSGNPRPRLFRVPEAQALINRMGFNSAGAEVVAQRLEHLRAMHRPNFPIGVNLGKNRDTPLAEAAQDYVKCVNRLYGVADYLVVNLSSPNTPGLTKLQEGEHLGPLLRQVREARDKMAKALPGLQRALFLKLSPDLTNGALKEAVETAMAEGFSGIIASNTSRRRDFIELKGLSLDLLEEEGGLSGAPLRTGALEQVQEIRALLGPKPLLISVGGLGGVSDAKARLDAGANFLQTYTAFVYEGPSYPQRIARGLRKP